MGLPELLAARISTEEPLVNLTAEEPEPQDHVQDQDRRSARQTLEVAAALFSVADFPGSQAPISRDTDVSRQVRHRSCLWPAVNVSGNLKDMDPKNEGLC